MVEELDEEFEAFKEFDGMVEEFDSIAEDFSTEFDGMDGELPKEFDLELDFEPTSARDATKKRG